MLLPGNQKTYDPDFVVTIGGRDVTKITKRWSLEDVEDGISSLTVTLANPDGKYSGVFKTEQEISLNFGYHKGEVSSTIRMKIKDKREDFPTKQGPTIRLVALDCTERLVGVTAAGNSDINDVKEILKSIIEGHKMTPDVNVKQPEKMPPVVSVHNQTGYAAIRWLMGMTECGEKQKSDGEDPIKGQPEFNFGKHFPNAEIVNGDRAIMSMIDAGLKSIGDIRINNRRNRAGTTTIVGFLEVVGQPMLQAKKCLTVQNVGPEASGKWYVKRLVQEWDVGHGYRTISNLLRPTLGQDGKAIDQPVVLYADIYKKDTVYVGCRKINSESQATFTYGTGENVMHFWWGIKLQRGRGGGEIAKAKGWAINNWGQIQKSEAKKDGSYNSYPPSMSGIMD